MLKTCGDGGDKVLQNWVKQVPAEGQESGYLELSSTPCHY